MQKEHQKGRDPDGYAGAPTGYVIEMEAGRYYAGAASGRICCRPLEGARYYKTHQAAKEAACCELGYVGLRVQICFVCYTLVETESLEGTWRFYQKDGEPVRFPGYQQARAYQRERSLEEDSMIELYAFREEAICPAA